MYFQMFIVLFVGATQPFLFFVLYLARPAYYSLVAVSSHCRAPAWRTWRLRLRKHFSVMQHRRRYDHRTIQNTKGNPQSSMRDEIEALSRKPRIIPATFM